MRQYYYDKPRPTDFISVQAVLKSIGEDFEIATIAYYPKSTIVYPVHKKDKGVILRFNMESKLPKRKIKTLGE